MASLALVFDILAKDGASSKFRDVGNSAERAGKQTSTFGTTVSGAMKLAAGAFLGAGLIQGFKSLYEAADESRKISALTGAVIKSTGGAANVSAKQVSDLAGAIAAKTGIDDEAIQSGQNLLLTFMNVKNQVGAGNDIFNQATQAVTDMSVALGKDAPSAATMLGKALNDPIKGITALSRAGVSFTEQQKEQIRTLTESGDILGAQKIILAELGKEFGGAAEAAATPLDKLRVRAGNLAEQVGGYLVPAVDRFATFAGDKLLPILEDAGTFLNATLVPAFKALASGVGFVADAWNGLPGPVQAGVVALVAFSALRGPVSAAMETIALRALYMKDAIVGAGTGIGGFKAAGAGLLGFLGGPWGIAIAAATTGLGFLVSWLNNSKDATDGAADSQTELASALRASRGAIDDTVTAAAALELQTKGVLDAAEIAGVSTEALTQGLLGNEAAYRTALAGLVGYRDAHTGLNGEQTAEAAAVREAITQYTNLAGATDGNITKAQQLARAKGELAQGTSVASGATRDFAAQMAEARGELDEGKKAIDDFKLALDLLTGETVSTIQVESAFQDAVDKAKGAVTELGGSVLDSSGKLNLQSENGRKAADVLLDVRNSGNDLIATLREQGATTDDLSARDAGLRKSFIDTANEMGISGQAAETLADQILGIPSERRTTISVQADAARIAIEGVKTLLSGITNKDVTVTVTQVAKQVGNFVGGLFGGPRAAGGPVLPNQAYLVGERGPELIFPSRAGFVATAQQTRDLGARAAGQEAAPRGPLDLSDSTIEKLAVAMLRGAGAAGSARESAQARALASRPR